jgi:hypothetical protein
MIRAEMIRAETVGVERFEGRKGRKGWGGGDYRTDSECVSGKGLRHGMAVVMSRDWNKNQINRHTRTRDSHLRSLLCHRPAIVEKVIEILFEGSHGTICVCL